MYEIKDKWKPVIIWISFLIINVILAILVGMSPDKTLFERTQFAWMGCVFIFIGTFGLRFKSINFLKGFSFSYDEVSDRKRKIGLTINIIGLIAGIVLFCYGVYRFLAYST